MKKGITYYFGFTGNFEERVKAIANAGFDEVILNADSRFESQNGKFSKQIKLFKKYGVGFSSLHFRYKEKELTEFWKDNSIGKTMQKNLIKDIKLAKKHGFSCVVVHLKGKTSKIGYSRLDKALKLCAKLNIPLAFENLSENQILFEVLEHYKDNPYAKFCYDAGHHNFADCDFDFLKIYGDKLICFHLHDNKGKASKFDAIIDEHTLNKYGSIDWDNLSKKFASLKFIPPLDYELMYKVDHGDTMDEVVNETFKQACELEQMIEKYKNH